jgi:D-3-phosphoglycerate dehydrogenase / 2-oxoglutarate reductase
MAHKILVCENIHQRGVDRFALRAGFDLDLRLGLERPDLLDIVGNYDALIVRRRTVVDKELLSAAQRLRAVGVGGNRLDGVDLLEATRRGVAVMNTPGRNAIARAEHALSLLMALHRLIPQASASMKDGRWEKKKFQGREMAGRTLGVIGFGEVGALVCKLASKGLRMQVLVYDLAVEPDAAAQMGARTASLDDALRKADAVTLHTPLNERTTGLIDARAFEIMKQGAILVNCGPCDVVKTDALLDALKSGKVSGVGLDVEEEEFRCDAELRAHPGVVLTPDLGGATDEAEIAIAETIADQIMDFLEEGYVPNAVNLPPISRAEMAVLGPYMDLAGRLGRFLGGLTSGPITGLTVECGGEPAGRDVAPVTNAALVGLLHRFEGPDINLVNAPVIARERGLRISETVRGDHVGNAPSVTLSARLADGTVRSVGGAIIETETREPRIIRIDGFVTEAPPVGAMLIVTNRDVPGMIAGIAGALASHGVNIAQMNLSRQRMGGMALAIINIDEPASDAVLEDIIRIEGVLSARQVRLD